MSNQSNCLHTILHTTSDSVKENEAKAKEQNSTILSSPETL